MDSIATEDACINAMLLSSNLIFETVLNAAVELDLFGIIAKAGPAAYVSATDIASQLPAKNPDAPSMLDRLLRLLASHSVLSYSLRSPKDGSVERVYGLTPASKFFINGRKEEGTLSPYITYSHLIASVIGRLSIKDAILEGGDSFERAHGMSIFEYLKKNPEMSSKFSECMAGISTIAMNGILEVYKGFEGLTSLVDVGGCSGKILNMIISKYPSINGINYDLPHVVQSAPQYPGVQHVGGDMFVGVPKGEAIMIMGACHNWNDENVVKILKNIYKELPNGGKLIIVDTIMPKELDTTNVSQYMSRLDNMMLALPVGQERNTQEFKALTEAAGFTNFRVACVACSIWAVMESYK